MTQPNINTFSPSSSPTGKHNVPTFSPRSKVVVTGAGAFGGWSALYLLRKGFDVTLIDAWGAGNSRSSSGDETRVIRSTYGANELYFDLNVRALQLWKENELRWGKKIFYNVGVIWFCYEQNTPLVDDSIAFAIKNKMEYEYLNKEQVSRRFKIVNTNDLHHAYLDSYGGYLKARESCQAVADAFVKEGGKFIQGYVTPGVIKGGELQSISVGHTTDLTADAYIFACGAWLGKIFPDVLGDTITCTKQEVYYFGIPHQYASAFENFPAWIDVDGKDFYYGIAGNTHRGFKIGVDKRGENFDPTGGDRTIKQEVLEHARKFLGHRFPGLANAPLVENRVCPYESSPTGNFIFATHPEAQNLLFLGGGSGHGFKHGPALGELVANTLSGDTPVPDLFKIDYKPQVI